MKKIKFCFIQVILKMLCYVLKYLYQTILLLCILDFQAEVILYFIGKTKSVQNKSMDHQIFCKKEIAFGDIAYDFAEIDGLIQKNYTIPQPDDYKNIYDQLVEYKEGDNTEKAYQYIYSNILSISN